MSRVKIILGGTAVLVAVLIGLLVLAPGGPPPVDTSLPNPNGYDLIVQAGTVVRHVQKGVSTLEREELAALVRDNQAALELARKGLALPCKLPMPANMDAMERHQPTAGTHKSLALAFVAEGRLRALQGDASGAARSYLDAVKLGPAVTRGGLIIDLMIGQAVMSLGADKLVEISQSLPPAECRVAADGLKEQLRQFPPIKEIEANEDYFFARNNDLRGRLVMKFGRWIPAFRGAREAIRAKAAQKLDLLHKRAAELSARAEALETKPAR
jgi:hypothetical protein